ncbi:MAG TPA: PEP-CTERM sorting domain-containing protein [Candidatus Sulfopaludibacter sp.]|nr:PEP-CTERM sorting domain-containing protein [Candidatus Sulfopaludibacter sp.]
MTNTGTGTLYRFFSIVDNGWLRIRVRDLNNDGVPDTVTLIDYAYNNLGRYRGIYPGIAAIRAGVGVPGPEPGSASMMLLAAGAAGVVAWKRRRKAA